MKWLHLDVLLANLQVALVGLRRPFERPVVVVRVTITAIQFGVADMYTEVC